MPELRRRVRGIEPTDDERTNMQSFCGFCGKRMAGDTKFCPECGEVVAPEIVQSSKPGVLEVDARGSAEESNTKNFPSPPTIHWAVLLALSILTLGWFADVWAFILAVW